MTPNQTDLNDNLKSLIEANDELISKAETMLDNINSSTSNRAEAKEMLKFGRLVEEKLMQIAAKVAILTNMPHDEILKALGK
jgi:hypothetical protein